MIVIVGPTPLMQIGVDVRVIVTVLVLVPMLMGMRMAVRMRVHLVAVLVLVGMRMVVSMAVAMLMGMAVRLVVGVPVVGLRVGHGLLHRSKVSKVEPIWVSIVVPPIRVAGRENRVACTITIPEKWGEGAREL